jgi:hypothetical protein
VTGALRSQYGAVDLIGRGQSGSVYRVHSEGDQPLLAIKVLHPPLSEDPNVIARAHQLRNPLRALRNPHLVAVTDLVIESDSLAIISEYVAGDTLAHHLRTQPRQPEAVALSIVQQVLSGLAAAHSRGFFHGHLTAQQVLLTTSGSGQVMARVSDLATGLLTREARIDDHPDVSTDLVATGALLHEMLTGKQPSLRAGRMYPRRREPAAVSPAVWGVVKTLLACDEAGSPSSIQEALKLVDEVLASLDTEEPEHSAQAFDITGTITPAHTPSITNLPPLPEPAGSLVHHVVPEHVQRRRWFRVGALAVLAFLALGGIAAELILGLSSRGPRQFTYLSVESSAAPGVQTTRSWTLTGGEHPALHVQLQFATTTTTTAKVEEVLPSSLLAVGSNVVFSQLQPSHVDGEHIVSYAINTSGARIVDASYDVAVPPKDFSESALLGWSDEQRAEMGARYRAGHTLATISLPQAIAVTLKQTIALPLTGLQLDGTVAPSAAFGGATYRIDNERIATIGNDGMLVGLKVGRTVVHVTLGKFAVSSTVYVVAPSTTPAAVLTPLQASLAGTTSAATLALNTSDGSSSKTGTSKRNGTTTKNGAAVGPAGTPTAPSRPSTKPTTKPTANPTPAPPTKPATKPTTGGGTPSTAPPATTPAPPTTPPPTPPPTTPPAPPSSAPPSGGGPKGPPGPPTVIGVG